jgi:hypothetical protein
MPERLTQTFSKGEIELPGLGQKIVLPDKTAFRYDGKVRSLERNIARTELIIKQMLADNRTIIERIVVPVLNEFTIREATAVVKWRSPGLATAMGYCYEHDLGNRETAYVIAQRRSLNQQDSIFTDGHESGKLLRNLGKIQTVQDMVDAVGGGIDVFKSVLDPDDFADLCGILALNRAVRSGVKNIVPCADDFGKQNRAFALKLGF